MSDNFKKQKHKTQTGGLQEKKVKPVLTKEELKVEQKAEHAKRRAKAKERKKDKPNIFVRIWKGIREIIGELRKVRWPSFQRTITQTGVVLGVVVVFSLIVFGIDRGLGELFRLLTRGLG